MGSFNQASRRRASAGQSVESDAAANMIERRRSLWWAELSEDRSVNFAIQVTKVRL